MWGKEETAISLPISRAFFASLFTARLSWSLEQAYFVLALSFQEKNENRSEIELQQSSRNSLAGR